MMSKAQTVVMIFLIIIISTLAGFFAGYCVVLLFNTANFFVFYLAVIVGILITYKILINFYSRFVNRQKKHIK